MTKFKIIKFIVKSYRDIWCFLGIHNYTKGVEWIRNARKDECSNCYTVNATYGRYKTCRWVADEKAYALWERQQQAKMETRKIILGKYDYSPPDSVSNPEIEDVDG